MNETQMMKRSNGGGDTEKEIYKKNRVTDYSGRI
jgi:hypothetical protein